MLDLNPNLASFELTRDRDDVTLAVGLRVAGDSVAFRLLGDKHTFYRMSMGVRLDENLATLAQADPNIEAAGMGVEGDRLILRLRHAQLPGAAPAASAPPPVPAPAPAAVPAPKAPAARRGGTPPGAETEVAVTPRPDAPPAPRRPEVSEAPAPVPARATPPPVSAPRDGAADAYRQALAAGNLQALVRFLDQYPDAPQAGEARARADRMREEAGYTTALERNDFEGYRAFLEHFPQSTHRGEIEARLRVAEEQRRRSEAERRAKQEEKQRLAGEKKRRAEAYETARKLDTPEAYRMFLAVYPNSDEANRARLRLEALDADDRAYAKARDTDKGLAAYLKSHPDGRHAGEARERLAARARPARPTPAPPADAPVLGVFPAEQAPQVDGDGSDPAWAEAAPLDLTLQGSSGTGTVRVRAVHHAERLYLLVQWPDATRDEAYRPWLWNRQRGTYDQGEQVDDALAVFLYRGTPPGDSCMLAGQDHEADTWTWRAFWGGLSGLADDGQMQVRGERIPQANPYPLRGGSGQIWVRQSPDRGFPGWSLFIPVDFQGDSLASYRATQATGSRADVRARGEWSPTESGGTWTVELARDFDTGNADDVALGPQGAAAFAVYDHADKGDHATSSVVRLELRGR